MADWRAKPRGYHPRRRSRAFTDEQVREIRQRYGRWDTADLSIVYGVSASSIWKIATGRTYREVK